MPHGKQQISFWKRSGLLEYMNIPHQNVDLFLSFCGIEQCVPGHFYNKLRSEQQPQRILFERTSGNLRTYELRKQRRPVHARKLHEADYRCADRFRASH